MMWFLLAAAQLDLAPVRRANDVVYAQGLVGCPHGVAAGRPSSCRVVNLTLDMFYTEGGSSSPKPAIVIMHGGGDFGGSRREGVLEGTANFFARRGFVAFNIDYRLSLQIGAAPELPPDELGWAPTWAAGYPAARDLKAAIRFVRARAAEFGVDSSRMVATGGSAGATNVVAAAVTFEQDFTREFTHAQDPTLASTHLEQSSKVQAVVSHWASDGMITLIERYDALHTSRYSSANAPILEFHGDEDTTIPLDRARAVQAQYARTGVPYELRVLKGCAHGRWCYGCAVGTCRCADGLAGYCTSPGSMDELAWPFVAHHLGVRNRAGASLLSQPGGPVNGELYLGPNSTHLPRPLRLSGPIPPDGGASTWMITQWQTPAGLPAVAIRPSTPTTPCARPPTAESATVPSWYTHSEAGAVCVFPPSLHNRTVSGGAKLVELSAHAVVLQQSGRGAPTSQVAPHDRLQCGLEFDTFLSPTSASVYPGAPEGMRSSLPLSSLAHLNVSFEAALLRSAAYERCGKLPYCNAGLKDIDYGYAVVGVTCRNEPRGQTFFYQIELWDTRCTSCASPCPCTRRPQSWYAITNPYGANDASANFEGSPSCIRPGEPPAHFDLDVLPKLHEAITGSGAPSDMGSNLTEWRAEHVYVGLGLAGDTEQALWLRDVDLRQVAKEE